MAVQPSWSGTITTGAYSDEEHKLTPTGSKTVANCFTENVYHRILFPQSTETNYSLLVIKVTTMTLKTKLLTQWILDAQSVALNKNG